MFNITKSTINWCGKDLTIETGKIARQATSSVVATYGGTSVLATLVVAKEAKPGMDFFPLTVNYIDKYYAVGRIPGGYVKRETKPKDHEVLIARLIDRPIRPLFPKGFHNEVNVTVQTLSYDKENPVDVVAMVGAMAALSISGAPVFDLLGACRVGLIEGEFVFNPTNAQKEQSILDLMLAATKEGVLMIESEADELEESKMLDAIEKGHEKCKELISFLGDFAPEVNKEKMATKEPCELEQSLHKEIESFAKEKFAASYSILAKQERVESLNKVVAETKEHILNLNKFEEELIELKFDTLVKDVKKDVVRTSVLQTSKRIDGRGLKDVRPIEVETSLFERCHGSALFTRGETQALVLTTLGTKEDMQMSESLDGVKENPFVLHYNFPSYSVGETGPLRAPGRREIGHGKLASRAIEKVLNKQNQEDFPYAVRVVSEITESNGSSSMATVCGTSLSLMDAGVPFEPVAGIAMGLIKEGNDYAVLTDILGDEDHLGDMDFKVAGTEKGVTVLQMDIKITSINKEIMQQALMQAQEGRMHILGKMNAVLSQSKESVSKYAPVMISMKINKNKIRDVIGAGGKIIKQITEDFKVKVSINDDGEVKIAGDCTQDVQKAQEHIKALTASVEPGQTYKGKVVKVIDAGAFVNLIGSIDGFLHISKFARPEDLKKRIAKSHDYVKEGDVLDVEVVELGDKGRVSLKLKEI